MHAAYKSGECPRCWADSEQSLKKRATHFVHHFYPKFLLWRADYSISLALLNKMLMETVVDLKCFLVPVLEDCSRHSVDWTFDAETTNGNSVTRFLSTVQQQRQVRNPPTIVWVVDGRCSTTLQSSPDCKNVLIDPEIWWRNSPKPIETVQHHKNNGNYLIQFIVT